MRALVPQEVMMRGAEALPATCPRQPPGQGRREHLSMRMTLLQDAANATLRSETLSRNCVRCINHKRGCEKPSKEVQNVCNGGCIKHGSDFSCVCDPGHTVQSNELFAMRQNKIKGQPDEGVCDIEHTVHSDELFVIRPHVGIKTGGSRVGGPELCV